MGPLNDEIKINVDEKNNKNWKIKKSSTFLKMYCIINFQTLRNQLTALGIII